MFYFWFFVESESDPVSAEIPDNRITMAFCIFLYGFAYISQKSPGTGGLYSQFQAFAGDVYQFPIGWGDVADHKHTRGVGKIAV